MSKKTITVHELWRALDVVQAHLRTASAHRRALLRDYVIPPQYLGRMEELRDAIWKAIGDAYALQVTAMAAMEDSPYVYRDKETRDDPAAPGRALESNDSDGTTRTSDNTLEVHYDPNDA